MTVTRWDGREGTRGYQRHKELVRPRLIIEDPPENPDVEIDWSYVAAVAMRTPGQWMRVVVDIPGWVPHPSSANTAPMRRNNVRSVLRGAYVYVRYDGPTD